MGEIWQSVIHASECEACEDCGAPICPHCEAHYADCDCPGPHQDDEYEYRWDEAGRMFARKKPAAEGD